MRTRRVRRSIDGCASRVCGGSCASSMHRRIAIATNVASTRDRWLLMEGMRTAPLFPGRSPRARLRLWRRVGNGAAIRCGSRPQVQLQQRLEAGGPPRVRIQSIRGEPMRPCPWAGASGLLEGAEMSLSFVVAEVLAVVHAHACRRSSSCSGAIASTHRTTRQRDAGWARAAVRLRYPRRCCTRRADRQASCPDLGLWPKGRT